MKKIEVNGYTFYYSIGFEVGDDNGIYEWTDFFLKTKSITRKKWWIFGPKITYEIGDPKSFVFKINFAIDDKRFTKLETRNAIEHQIELWKRPMEIKNGELI